MSPHDVPMEALRGGGSLSLYPFATSVLESVGGQHQAQE
jgi:hypothetical protein